MQRLLRCQQLAARSGLRRVPSLLLPPVRRHLCTRPPPRLAGTRSLLCSGRACSWGALAAPDRAALVRPVCAWGAAGRYGRDVQTREVRSHEQYGLCWLHLVERSGAQTSIRSRQRVKCDRDYVRFAHSLDLTRHALSERKTLMITSTTTAKSSEVVSEQQGFI